MRVLIYPAGTEIGLEVFRALSPIRQIEVVAANDSENNHAQYCFAEHVVLPHVHDSDFISELNRVIKTQRIDVIYPAHDEVILALAEQREAIDAQCIAPFKEQAEQLRYKSRTYQVLEGIVPVPTIYRSASEVPSWPVFAKPDRGQGSQGVTIIEDEASFRAIAERPDYLVCEYLSEEEYTIDCFSDADHHLQFAAARLRERTRNGISMRSRDVDCTPFQAFAEAISQRCKMAGGWFFQMKRNGAGELKLLEVSARIAGTSCLQRAKGVNLPLLSLYLATGSKVSVCANACHTSIDRALYARYRLDMSVKRIFVDFDDCLYLAGKMNSALLAMLYDYKAEGVVIEMITRHNARHDTTIEQVLEQLHLNRGFFDAIHHLAEGEAKSAYIPPHKREGAIFIDDSFAERSDVSRFCGIPTFDLSAIEALCFRAAS